ncbi:hypothetical protein ABS767_00200 [Sphingomonas sp. ST-64]|uniref:Uncharacterized protein n=1 Tax=Sphingomonas plantiphila TaxID=3163295 RepID=A0ABW8YGK6_9SPHN
MGRIVFLKQLTASVVLIASCWLLYEAIRLDQIFNLGELATESLIARGLCVLSGLLASSYLIGSVFRRGD